MNNCNQPLAMPKELLGLSEAHLHNVPELGGLVHVDIIKPLSALISQGAKSGFTIKIASGYRSFERQLAIWNAKALGQRVVLDSGGCPLDLECLSPYEKVMAILRWSALPGASRHHWGCDVDVYDAAVMSADYNLQLTQSECEAGGVFADFHCWLTQRLSSTNTSLGFVRPFNVDRGGVAPEPWHLSYAPVANIFSKQLTMDILYRQLSKTELVLKSAVLDNLDEIYTRFIIHNEI